MSLQNLKNFRRFYLTYPELMGPVVAYLAAFQGDRPSGWNFVVPEITSVAKGQSATVFFPKPGTATEKGQLATVFSESHEIVVQVGDELKISPYHLFGRLSFTHIVELLRLPDEIQRTFYAFEAIRGTWSVKELRRQIDSQYYIRSGWSAKPSKLSALTMEKAEKDTLRATLRSPHVFEFLGLAAKDVWEESDLEQGIIDHLQEFILEMGLGLCFEARQKKILIDDQYYKIDLVFYHRILKCHVLVELKSRSFDYADAAQLGVYLAYYRKNVCRQDDNPPIGILLCTEAGREMAEYVSTFIDPALFVSKYELELPPKEKIVTFLRDENGQPH